MHVEFSDVIQKRRSTRKFTDTRISRDVIKELIRAAQMAPTASNLQAWRFIVADDLVIVKQVCMFSPGISGHPPVVIAVASDLREVEERGSENSIRYGCMMDAAMAAKNLMLAAADRGLGTCAIKSYNPTAVKKILRIPDYFRLELLVTLGVSENETAAPARKPLEKVLFWNSGDERNV